MLNPAWSSNCDELDFVGKPDWRVRDPVSHLVDHVRSERGPQHRRAAADGAVEERLVRQARKVRLVTAEEIRVQPLSLVVVAGAEPVRGERL